MILAVALIMGLYSAISLQLSYASLLSADDSECVIFCPRIEDSMNYDYNFNQQNECGNKIVDPNGGGIFLHEQFGNSTSSNDKIVCTNTASP